MKLRRGGECSNYISKDFLIENQITNAKLHVFSSEIPSNFKMVKRHSCEIQLTYVAFDVIFACFES